MTLLSLELRTVREISATGRQQYDIHCLHNYLISSFLLLQHRTPCCPLILYFLIFRMRLAFLRLWPSATGGASTFPPQPPFNVFPASTAHRSLNRN